MSTITFDKSAASAQLQTLDSNSDLNRYLWIRPEDEASSARTKEFLYKLAAGVSMVAIGILIIRLTVLAAMTQPYLVPIPLLLGGGAYKILYKKVFTPLLEKGQQAAVEHKNLQNIQKIVEMIKSKNLDYFGYAKVLSNLGVSSWEVQNQADLARLNEYGNAFEPLDNLIGRLAHWTTKAKEIEIELRGAQQELQEKEAKLRKTNLSEDEEKQLKSERRQLKIKIIRIEQEQLLPVKLAAAYDRHVICNVRDKREYTEFGHPAALNYLDHLENAIDGTENHYFYYPPESRRSPETKEWLLSASISEISQRIFPAAA